MRARWITAAGLTGALAIASLVWAATPPPADDDDALGFDPVAGQEWCCAYGGPRFGPGDRPGPMMGRLERRGAMMRELDLTPEQRDRIAGIRERQARRAIQQRADLQTGMLDLRKLMRAERPDRVAIDRQIDTVARLRGGLHKFQVETLLDVRSVLTPEQQGKLREQRMDGCRMGAGRTGAGRMGAGCMDGCRMGAGRMDGCRMGAGCMDGCRMGAGCMDGCRMGAGRTGAGRMGAGRMGRDS